MSRAKFLGNNGLFCYVSICKFGSLKNPFVMITNLSELCFRFRRFIFLMQTKKVISMNYSSSASSWKPLEWVRLDLIFCMRDIYIISNLKPLIKLTGSSRRSKLKDILSWSISQIITKIITISTKIFISYVMKRGILFWISWKVNGNNNMISISQWRESHCRSNASIKKERNPKEQSMRMTVWDLSRKGNQLSKVIWDKL